MKLSVNKFFIANFALLFSKGGEGGNVWKSLPAFWAKLVQLTKQQISWEENGGKLPQMSILSIGKIPKRSPYRFWTLLEKTKDSNTGRKSVRQAWDKAMQKKCREIVPSEVKAIPTWCFVLADSGQTSYYCVVYLNGQCHKNFERFGGCARGSLLASQRKATHVYSMWDLKICCLILSIFRLFVWY